MSTTSENNKRIAKNTLLLYFRMFFTMAISLYTSRIVLQALGVEDFGIYNVVGGVVAMMTILNGSMSVSTQRYLTFELGRGEMKRLTQVFSSCFLIYVILSLIILIIGETVGLWFLNTKMVIPVERLSATNWVYQFSLFSCIVTMMTAPYNAIIIAREKMNVYAYISIIEVILKLGIVFLLFRLPYDRLVIYGVLILLLTIAINSAYVIYCISCYAESRYKFYWDKPLFKELVSYSGWNIFGSLSGLVKSQGLNILLNMFFNPVVNASRGIAYQINTAITHFFTNFYMAVRPQITKYYAQNDLENMYKLVFRSSRFSFYLIYIISLPILVEAPFIIQLWLGQLPDYVVIFTRLIVVISAIDSMASPIMTTCHATGRIKLYQSVVGTIIILNVPISYVLLKYAEGTPVTVFVVSLILSTIGFFARLWIVKRLMDFPIVRYIREVILPTMCICFFSAVIPLVIQMYISEGWISSCIVMISCLLSSMVFIYLLGMTQGEKEYIINTIRNRIKR